MFLCSLLFSNQSSNHFFVIDKSLSLECEDIIEVFHSDSKVVTVRYNKKGQKKLYDLTKESVGKSLGIIVDDKVILFNIKIFAPMATADFQGNTVNFATKSVNDARLLKKSFGKCK
jgi:preprotein translocase subunit SecD